MREDGPEMKFAKHAEKKHQIFDDTKLIHF